MSGIKSNHETLLSFDEPVPISNHKPNNNYMFELGNVDDEYIDDEDTQGLFLGEEQNDITGGQELEQSVSCSHSSFYWSHTSLTSQDLPPTLPIQYL